MGKLPVIKPPKIGKYLLRKIYGSELYDEIAGDFLEVFQQRSERQGQLLASVRYIWDALLSIRNMDLKNKNSTITKNNIIMVKNYFKMALRVLQKHPTNSAINVLGLAVGMGVCLMIYQYISFEYSFDQFHPKAEQTYRIVRDYYTDEKFEGSSVHTSYGLGVAGKENIPELQQFARLHPQYGGAVVTNPENNTPYQEKGIFYVDQNFLDVFGFDIKTGSRGKALEGRQNIVITEQTAIKYFGRTDPMGKTLTLSGGWVPGDFTVTGVLYDLPRNSHLQFDFLIPINILLEEHNQYKDSDGWGWNNFITYITLNEQADLEQLAEKYDEVIATFNPDHGKSGYLVKTKFQSLLDIHLNSDFAGDPVTNNGSIRDVQIFSIIAIIILVIAWVNYINLSTARALYRAKEVGVRKSIGAFRSQLIGQFMVESCFTNIIAAVLALGLAYGLLPVLNDITGKQLALAVLWDWSFWLSFVAIVIGGSMLSGLYPAFVLSAFQPASMLRRTMKKGGRGAFNLRRGLILFQFLVSTLLIAGTYLVYTQVSYMKNKELGIDMEKILVVTGPDVGINRDNAEEKLQTFKTKVESHHTVLSVSGMQSIPGKGHNWATWLWKFGRPEETRETGHLVFVDHSFTDTYDFEFLAGRSFIDMASDDKAMIVNQETLRVFDLGSPEEAIRQKMVIDGWDTIQIVGVLKDFHWNSLKGSHSPYMFINHSRSSSYMCVKMDLTDIPSSLAHIEEAFLSVYPGNPFNYSFLEDDFNNQYQADLQFGNLFSAFSLLAIFISSLGLFGLVSFSTNARIKEIGIRKTLGAEVKSLMLLLSKEYMILLLIANVLAIPAILYWGQAWLDDYAYNVSLGYQFFVVPGLILLIISLLTVSYRTYMAAKSDPVKVLNVE